MPGRAFLDTNILIYAFAEDDWRLDVAERIVNEGGTISVQVLNETASLLHRKFGFRWQRIREILDTVESTCPKPLPLTMETHNQAIEIAARFGLNLYDGLIVASAHEAGCSVLYSEDLQHGQVIEGVRIVNPFL
jgi:predicted nucleic acid-binding protein